MIEVDESGNSVIVRYNGDGWSKEAVVVGMSKSDVEEMADAIVETHDLKTPHSE